MGPCRVGVPCGKWGLHEGLGSDGARGPSSLLALESPQRDHRLLGPELGHLEEQVTLLLFYCDCTCTAVGVCTDLGGIGNILKFLVAIKTRATLPTLSLSLSQRLV